LYCFSSINPHFIVQSTFAGSIVVISFVVFFLLQMAAWLDHHEICKVLLDAGAHVEQKDKYGRTALTIAAIRGSEYCGKMLVEHGADLDTSGRTSHHTDVVGHAEQAATHVDAAHSARVLHAFLKKTKDDRNQVETEKQLLIKQELKKERAEKRAQKKKDKEEAAAQEEVKEENVGL
jgi:ankyrin repeat protein